MEAASLPVFAGSKEIFVRKPNLEKTAAWWRQIIEAETDFEGRPRPQGDKLIPGRMSLSLQLNRE
jgi:hypothetical protein